MLSPAAWYPFVPLNLAEEKGEFFANLLGCKMENKTEELSCLRTKEADLFIERGPRFLFFHAFIGTITGPVIDNVNFGDPSLSTFQRVRLKEYLQQCEHRPNLFALRVTSILIFH